MKVLLPFAIFVLHNADIREVCARLRQQSAIDVEIFDRVVVAVDENIDALDVFEDIIRAVASGVGLAAEMADADDEVAARGLKGINLFLCCLVHCLFREEGQAARALRIGRRDGRWRRQAEDTDFETALLDDGMGFRREGFARRIDDDIRRHDGEFRLLDALRRHVGAIIEFVIAERHGIVAHGVHEVNGRLALAEIDKVVVLNRIAGIDEQDLIALGLIIFLECRDRHHAVDTVGALVVAMRIIRMHDDEMRKIRRKRRTPEAGKDECQHCQYFLHTFTPFSGSSGCQPVFYHDIRIYPASH